jgi:hypothetical protein
MNAYLDKKDKKQLEVTVYLFSDIFLVLSSYKGGGKSKVERNIHYKNMRVADVDYGGLDQCMQIYIFLVLLYYNIFCSNIIYFLYSIIILLLH